MVVLWLPATGIRRVGFAVSRQMGSAVKRNRARRRLRAAYRAVRQALPDGIVAVVVGKRRALTAKFSELVSDLGSAGAVLVSGRGAS